MLERNKKEIQRWLNNPKEPKIWYRDIDKKGEWDKTKFSGCVWSDNYYYIVDDKHAELRKFQLDEPNAEFEFFDIEDCEWIEISTPSWDIDVEYRIKPIFKVGDKIKYNEIYIIKELLNDRYILNDNSYILFKNQFRYKKIDKSLIEKEV